MTQPIFATTKDGKVHLHVPSPETAMTPNNAIVLATGLIEAALQARRQNEGYAKHIVDELMERINGKDCL